MSNRFRISSGTVGLTGTELIVKGALEAGVSLVTGYPGSPISGVFDTVAEIAPYLSELGVLAQLANNEALAAARLYGARQTGARALAVMKSVGLHVASDALAIGNINEYHKPDGGAVVVVGDDPWNESTQIPSDSRFLSRHLHMPVVTPSSLQEMKDFIDVAFDISGYSDLFVTFVVTATQADGGGTVQAKQNRAPSMGVKNPLTLSAAGFDPRDLVMVPPHISAREASLAARFERAIERARARGINRLWGLAGPCPIGFVTSGIASGYLEMFLELTGLAGRVPVVNLGMPYPLDVELVAGVAARVGDLIVVEEKRGFLEESITSSLVGLAQTGRLGRLPRIWGKALPGKAQGLPAVGGLNPSVVFQILGSSLLEWPTPIPEFDRAATERELQRIAETKRPGHAIPVRTPTFCPGCPHRDSAVVAKAAVRNNSAKDLLFHGESGCHTMLAFEPNGALMQNYSGMGLGGGSGAGMAPHVSNKQVVFLGDSTFFHSGFLAVSDSVKNRQDITYVILENGTTAMTGHQPTPASGEDVMGRPTDQQDIERLLRAMLPDPSAVVRLDPSDRAAYEPLFASTVERPGVKVIIADKECAITLNRKLTAKRQRGTRALGYLPIEEKISINTEVCEFCLACTRQTGCPGLAVVDTPLGPKLNTDLSSCVDDGACTGTRACPSFQRIRIVRNGPRVVATIPEVALPEPTPDVPTRWNAYIAGVGGMGVGVMTGVLARAAEIDGYQVGFVNRKGLAIRNGSVFGHLLLSKSEPVSAPVFSYGSADLIFGLDALEAARGCDPSGSQRVAHARRTRAVVDAFDHPTISALTGRQERGNMGSLAMLRDRLRENGLLTADFSTAAETYIGSKLYANAVLLGAAFQQGWVPLRATSLLSAIGEMIEEPGERAKNLTAFDLGRRMAASPESFRRAGPLPGERVNDLARRLGSLGAVYRAFLNWTESALPSDDRLFLIQASYDILRYGGPALLKRYERVLQRVAAADRESGGDPCTSAVARSLYTLLVVKDPFWVAQLLISDESLERDMARFGLDAARGDRIEYHYLTRPSVRIFGVTFEFGLAARGWMLRLVANFRFLRRFRDGRSKVERRLVGEYLGMLEALCANPGRGEIRDWMAAAAVPQAVRGFRGIRELEIEKALRAMEAILISKGRNKPAGEE